MFNSTTMLSILLIAAILVLTQSAFSQDKSTTAPDARIKSVQKLVEQSSGARQVAKSSNPQALALQEKARELYQQAAQAISRENLVEAQSLLDSATSTMFEAVRAAGTPQGAVDKSRRDFEGRHESVSVLLAAYERVGAEKNADVSTFVREANGKLASAQTLYDKQEYKAGRRVLDEVYVETKTELERLRGGETLVNSLEFASKEEEYVYELDRNDTHKMLVDIFLEDKLKNERTAAMAKKFLEEAEKLRAEGLAQAAAGNYQKAIEILEESTRNLVRAIRGAGLYIPG